jgi:hypothetical protein
VSTNVTTYFWVVFYDDSAQVKPSARDSGSAKPQPAVADAIPKFISVVHRNLVSTYTTEYGMPRAGLPDETKYYRGKRESRVMAGDFHPSEDAADAWMKTNWAGLQAKGAVYAEMHSFAIDFKGMIGSTGPL